MEDEPTAALFTKKVTFETIIVLTNYRGSGLDKPIGGFSWGYDNYGTKPTHNALNFEVDFTFSKKSNEVLNIDYSRYNFYTPTLDYESLYFR